MSQKIEPVNAVWEINGISLRLDLDDADALERYENAFQVMETDAQNIPKDGKASDRVRAYCNVYRNLYDRIWGEGTADRIFAGQPTSAAVYEAVYASLLEFINAQNAAASERRAAILQKYTPNRAQRRAAKKR